MMLDCDIRRFFSDIHGVHLGFDEGVKRCLFCLDIGDQGEDVDGVTRV